MLAGDEVLATAILDRLLHYCHVLQIDGRSFHLGDMEQQLPKSDDPYDDAPVRRGGPSWERSSAQGCVADPRASASLTSGGRKAIRYNQPRHPGCANLGVP